jgi:hypothetical protein
MNKKPIKQRSLVAFVDDSTGQVHNITANPQPSPEVLNRFMQYNAQLWSDLLWLSVGLCLGTT